MAIAPAPDVSTPVKSRPALGSLCGGQTLSAVEGVNSNVDKSISGNPGAQGTPMHAGWVEGRSNLRTSSMLPSNFADDADLEEDEDNDADADGVAREGYCRAGMHDDDLPEAALTRKSEHGLQSVRMFLLQ